MVVGVEREEQHQLVLEIVRRLYPQKTEVLTVKNLLELFVKHHQLSLSQTQIICELQIKFILMEAH